LISSLHEVAACVGLDESIKTLQPIFIQLMKNNDAKIMSVVSKNLLNIMN